MAVSAVQRGMLLCSESPGAACFRIKYTATEDASPAFKIRTTAKTIHWVLKESSPVLQEKWTGESPLDEFYYAVTIFNRE